MKTSVERLEGNTVKLTVAVEAAEVDEAVSRAYKTIGSKVKIPGFRPGKAPRAVVDNTVGKEYVLAEATENLINDTYPKALDAENLRPIESPEMEELDTVTPGEGFTYEAEVEIRPELTLTSTENLTVELPSPDATDEEVDMQIDMYRDRMATLEPVEDRGVAADDYVLLSFVGTVDGESYEGNEVDKYLYEMNRGLMPPEFDEGLVGVEPGGQTRIEFEVPETTSNPDFIGKTAEFEVTVHEIKSKVLPALDDEFAQGIGGFSTMDDLRENIKEGIGVQKRYSYERTRERALREMIAERLEGDVPEVMVVSKKGSLTRDFEASLESRDLTLNDYLAQTGLTWEKIDADLDDHAAQTVREELALEALFRALDLEVTEEELDAELEQMAASSKQSPAEMRKRWEELGLLSVVQEEMMHRKAVLWLADNVEVIEPSGDSGTTDGSDKDADLPTAVDTFEVDAAAVEADGE